MANHYWRRPLTPFRNHTHCREGRLSVVILADAAHVSMRLGRRSEAGNIAIYFMLTLRVTPAMEAGK